MLAVSPLRTHDEKQQEGEAEISGTTFEGMGFSELVLDSIDFDDLFIGISDGDVLPDLEMDSEILPEFSDDYSDLNAALSSQEDKLPSSEAEDKLSASELSGGEVEIVSKREARARAKDGGRKESKNCQGKRKLKVDWTPDLHRRFVQAVEQLGMDKAVPSRILEIMGIDCLTRHNIASHLQKYRSHRKHLLAREAEAANWSQRRQMYAKSPPWPPTMGFPPMPPAAPQPPPHHFRPLHVWGHPSVDRSLVHAWPPNPPRPAASYWHSHHKRVPNALTPRTPFFPQPLPAPPRLIPPPVAAPYAHAPLPAGHGPGPGLHPFFDFLPTKESIDAAIGDVISKPWLPLPLGLKPPSTDSVMTELQRQGVPKVPPSCA